MVLFITNYDLLFRRKAADEIPASGKYRLFLLSVIIFFISDLLWGIFDHYDVHIADYVVTYTFFAVMAISVFLWSIYVVDYLGYRKVFSRLFKIVGLFLMITGLVIIIINLFHPIMFKFVDNGSGVREYQMLPFRTVYMIAQGVMFAMTAVYAFIVVSIAKDDRKRMSKHIAIGIFGLEMAFMIGFQVPFPGAPIYASGYLLGLLVINTFVVAEQKKEYRVALAEGLTREEKKDEELGSTRQLVYQDSLTKALSKHAYVEAEERIDREIADGKELLFAVSVFDLNDLKFINDNCGHDAGDKYIIESCQAIKSFFPKSTLYRYGGDEFVLFIEGDEYKNRHQVLEAFNKEIDKSFVTGNPIIATGISDYRPGKDNTFRAVFNRADERMYIRKKQLKEMGHIDPQKFLNKKGNESLAPRFNKEDLLKIREESTKRTNPRLSFYKLFYQNEEFPLIDMLNNSSCDEVMEVNLKEDTFQQFYHVDGKYSVPTIESSYDDLFEFVCDHIIHPDDRQTYYDYMNPKGFFERLRSNEIPNFGMEHFRYRLQGGGYRYVEQVVITGLENGIPEGCFRIYVFDAHNYKARQNGFIGNDSDMISKGRDSLTNLLLEKEFFAKCQELMASKPQEKWSLISIDIKHFRFFDEWYGKETGDLLLAKFGATLMESKAEFNGISGYFGKDDFGVLMPYNEEKIQKLQEKLKAVILSFGSTAGFIPVFGVAIMEKGLSLNDAFDRATIASAKAKGDVSKSICVYTPEMQFLAQKESRLLSEYMKAFKNDEITFYLQPQCRISSGKIVGVEALARWVKPDGSVVSPALFVPVLEKYGFIPDLDMHIWDKAFKALRTWIDKGYVPVPVSLNVARADLFAIDVAQCFIDLANKYKLPHEYIKVEITESSYVEATELVTKLVEKLHKNGFMVLMDDFGSGYSSLNMLSSLEIDAIKLDMHFLHFEGKDYEKAVHVLESVVNMAKVIGLPIIVEGVEKKEHVDFIESLGCRYIQGYYFYKPMPMSELKPIIENPDNLDNRGFVVKLNEQMRIREFLDKNIFSDSMLNNILGPVAFYSWNGKTTDIVRYNEQFYQAVRVPEFTERLEHIERFIHKDDAEKMHNAFRKAMEDKLMGASQILRFYTPDGTILSFNIHFYYLGKQENGERFYGAAQNVTTLTDLQEEKRLIASYSKDGMAFIRKVNNNYIYSFASRSLSDIFDITPEQLENELITGEFGRKRATNRRKYDMFKKTFIEFASQNRNFEATLEVYDYNHQPVTLYLNYTSVSDKSNNIEYILRTTVGL